MFYRIAATFYRNEETRQKLYDIWATSKRALKTAAKELLDSERDREGWDAYRIDRH